MINKNRAFFQYESGDLVYIISIVHSLKKSHNKILRTNSYLHNHRPSQLSINEITWQNIERTI